MSSRVMRVVLLLLLGVAAAAAEAASPQRQRFALLSAAMLRGGSRNVRWETRAVTLDGAGQPLVRAGGSGKAPCTDMNGKERAHGEEYTRFNNRFKFRCNNGIEDVAACIASERANRAPIAVGKSLDVDGFWHRCESHPNGSTVYTQEDSCRDASGKEIHINDEFSTANLRFRCGDGRFDVVGCSYKSAGGQDVALKGGERRKEGDTEHVCDEKDGTFQYSTLGGTSCTQRGVKHPEGEQFQANNLKYACKNGAIEIQGCYTKSGSDLAIGASKRDDKGTVQSCLRMGDLVEYSEYLCLKDKESECPPPKVNAPADMPALSRGQKAPGVGSFSIASGASPMKGIKLAFDRSKMGV